MKSDHRLHHAALVGVQVAAVDQVLGDLAALVATPSPERRDELVLIDQSILKRKQPEKKVAVRIDGDHGTSLQSVERRRQAVGPEGPAPLRTSVRIIVKLIPICCPVEKARASHPAMPCRFWKQFTAAFRWTAGLY